MKCTKTLVYNGRRFKAGEEFEVATPKDVTVLETIRKAERVRPSATPAWVAVAEEARKKRTYTRRDLVAEAPHSIPRPVQRPAPVVPEVSEPTAKE